MARKKPQYKPKKKFTQKTTDIMQSTLIRVSVLPFKQRTRTCWAIWSGNRTLGPVLTIIGSVLGLIALGIVLQYYYFIL